MLEMTNNNLIKNIVLALTIVSAMAIFKYAQATPFNLKPLHHSQTEKTTNSNNLATVAMIFQPDCSWCKKQGKALTEAFKQCKSSVNITLVGAKGNVRELKKELKHYHPGIPSFAADRKFLRAIGGYQASPTTLIYDDKGQLITKKRGFIPYDNLSKALNIISQGNCNI